MDIAKVLIRSAEIHGETSPEPDHEVGDLQDIIRLMAQRMTNADLEEVLDQHRQNQPEFVEDALEEFFSA